MFDKATLSFGTIKVISNVARMAGSSQQGNARRAPVGWKLKHPFSINIFVTTCSGRSLFNLFNHIILQFMKPP